MDTPQSPLATKCPQCAAPITFGAVEDKLPDGGVLLHSKPCPKCGHSIQIMRITKRGVYLRKQIERARAHAPVDQERLQRLVGEFHAQTTKLLD